MPIQWRVWPALLVGALCCATSAWPLAGDFDWATTTPRYPGVQYAAVSVASPRPMDAFCMRVDTQTPGLRFETTGRHEDWVENVVETRRQTTSNFLRASRASGEKMVVAINANAFSPWPAPWNQETLTDLVGLALRGGIVVSPGNGSYPSLTFLENGAAGHGVFGPADPLDNIRTAVSGFSYCLVAGVPVASGPALAPRTGLGLDQDQRHVLLLAVDGRRHASQGATVGEVGEWLRHFGAHTGINMDGGGSTALVQWRPGGDPATRAELLNRPVGSGINWLDLPPEVEQDLFEPQERANGNNLGVVVPHLDFGEEPQDAAVETGGSHFFTVAVIDATGPVLYQWHKDGAPIPGADGPVFAIVAASPADAGAYHCVVADDVMIVVSRAANLVVSAPMPLVVTILAPALLALLGAGAICRRARPIR